MQKLQCESLVIRGLGAHNGEDNRRLICGWHSSKRREAVDEDSRAQDCRRSSPIGDVVKPANQSNEVAAHGGKMTQFSNELLNNGVVVTVEFLDVLIPGPCMILISKKGGNLSFGIVSRQALTILPEFLGVKEDSQTAPLSVRAGE